MNTNRESYWAHSWALLTRDKGWIKPLLVLGAVLLVPIAGLIGVMGYAMEWARLTAWGVDAAPKQRNVNVGECMSSGWRGFVVMVAYSLTAAVFNTLIVLFFGDNAFSDTISTLFSFVVGIVGSVAVLHTAIYQKISAGFSFDRFVEMFKRDKQGFFKAVITYVVVSVVIGVALGLLYSFALVPVVVRVNYSLAGQGIVLSQHLSSTEFRYAMREVMTAIAAGAPLFAVLLYITGVALSFTMLIQYTVYGLWMRQFDVPSWGASNDPLPSGFIGLPMSSQSNVQQPYGGQPYQGQASTQNGYGQTNAYQQPYSQQPTVAQPYSQGGYPQQAAQNGPQSDARVAQGAQQQVYTPEPIQAMPVIVSLPAPESVPEQTTNAPLQMLPVKDDQVQQEVSEQEQALQPAQPEAEQIAENDNQPAFFGQVQAMETALNHDEATAQSEEDAPSDNESAAQSAEDALVHDEVTVQTNGASETPLETVYTENVQVEDHIIASEAVEPMTESSAIPEPIILPPVSAIASQVPQQVSNNNSYQAVVSHQEASAERVVDDDPIEVGDVIGDHGERVVEVISLSGTPRPKREESARPASGEPSIDDSAQDAPADCDQASGADAEGEGTLDSE